MDKGNDTFRDRYVTEISIGENSLFMNYKSTTIKKPFENVLMLY
jgi:hypothetical protein